MIKRLACVIVLALPLAAQDSEIEQLKQMLLDQQRQINELKTRLGMAVSDGVPVNAHPAIGEVASTKPMVPSAPAAPPTFTPPAAETTTAALPPVQGPDDATTSPLHFKLGDAYFTPVG